MSFISVSSELFVQFVCAQDFLFHWTNESSPLSLMLGFGVYTFSEVAISSSIQYGTGNKKQLGSAGNKFQQED